jgi:hypothetical protein
MLLMVRWWDAPIGHTADMAAAILGGHTASLRGGCASRLFVTRSSIQSQEFLDAIHSQGRVLTVLKIYQTSINKFKADTTLLE